MKDYGVSRITIIKAKDLLRRDNLIEHRAGRGSFVLSQNENTEEVPSHRVVFCLPTFADSYIAQILIGAARIALRENVQLEIIGLEKGDLEAARVRNAIQNGADGVLLLPRARYPDIAFFNELHNRGYPLVLLDRYYPDVETDRVTFDDEGAGYALTKLLIEKGHRRIAVFTGHEVEASSVCDRIRGYQRALEEAGLPYDEDLICLDVYDELSPASVYNLPSTYLRLLEHLHNGFTAIIAINRYVALQMSMDLMRIRSYLTQLPPDDPAKKTTDDLGIAIAAISNQPFTHEETSLAALAIQPGEVLGEEAMGLVVRRLQQGVSLPPQHISIPMEIIAVQ